MALISVSSHHLYTVRAQNMSSKNDHKTQINIEICGFCFQSKKVCVCEGHQIFCPPTTKRGYNIQMFDKIIFFKYRTRQIKATETNK